MTNYYCYLITNDTKTYIGITNNLEIRLKKHNGIIRGGAKATRAGKGLWKYVIVVGVFDSKSEAQSFEWYWKHNFVKKWVRTKSGLNNKINRLDVLLQDDKWKKIKIIKVN